ncbi:MAG: hypothetical protein PUC65_12720 [Clostridiales bacterium]|nr:hypothetical protein [Clostridiales bacterium]
MKNILGLVAEVEDKAVAILDSAKAQKQRLKEEESKKREDLEARKREEYQKQVSMYQSELDKKTEIEIQTLEEQVKHNKEALNSYYENNKNLLVSQLTKQVIGE